MAMGSAAQGGEHLTGDLFGDRLATTRGHHDPNEIARTEGDQLAVAVDVCQ
jgi:hypothetical protein